MAVFLSLFSNLLLILLLKLKSTNGSIIYTNFFSCYKNYDLTDEFKSSSQYYQKQEPIFKTNTLKCLTSFSSLDKVQTVLIYTYTDQISACFAFNSTPNILTQLKTSLNSTKVCVKKTDSKTSTTLTSSSSTTTTTTRFVNTTCQFKYLYWNGTSCVVPTLSFNQTVTSLLMLSNGLLVPGTYYGVLSLWNTTELKMISQFTITNFYDQSFAELPDGALAIGFNDFKTRIINTTTGSIIANLTEHTGTVEALAILKNGWIATGSHDRKIKIWEPHNTTSKQTLITDDFVYSLLVLKSGDLVSGGYCKFFVWNTTDWSYLNITNAHKNYISALVELENGYLITGSYDCDMIVWNVTNQTSFRILKGHSDYVLSMVVLSNGNLASAGRDKKILLWDMVNFMLKQTLTGHTNYINSLVILENVCIASGSDDNTIKIWNIS